MQNAESETNPNNKKMMMREANEMESVMVFVSASPRED